MREYAQTDSCLMEILRRELDDPMAAPCGRCARCTGESRARVPDRELVLKAQAFLRGQRLVLGPRKQLPDMKRIDKAEQLADGWALSRLGDGGWGGQVRNERESGSYSDQLVAPLVDLLASQSPDPPFEWVAAVPSLRAPDLVPSFARRVAEGLGLPYVDAVQRVRDSPPQAEMHNSAQQSRNVGGAFEITVPIPDTPCLLIDDIWDSGWTMTVLAQLLRTEGSGEVCGAVLAQ